MIRLLDVNVLLALVDPASLHHERAHKWLVANRAGFRWATCALTENGFCRVLSSAGYPGAVTPGQAVEALRGLRSGLAGHSFWRCEVSIADEGTFDWELVQGSKHLTDLYLVALAVKHKGRLVSFDQRIRWDIVEGAAVGVVEVL